jgi:hypothetical protein
LVTRKSGLLDQTNEIIPPHNYNYSLPFNGLPHGQSCFPDEPLPDNGDGAATGLFAGFAQRLLDVQVLTRFTFEDPALTSKPCFDIAFVG